MHTHIHIQKGKDRDRLTDSQDTDIYHQGNDEALILIFTLTQIGRQVDPAVL